MPCLSTFAVMLKTLGNSRDAFLAEMYHNLADVLDARPNAVVVPAAEGATQETYKAILANLREGV